MKIRMLCFAIVVCLTQQVLPAQEKTDNPFRTAKVGDFVAYNQTTSFLGKDIEISMKETVATRNERELTLRITARVKETDLPSHDTKIDLTKPYDPVTVATKADANSRFEKTGEGKEKIKVGGKTYDCDWLAGKVVDKDAKRMSEIKVWFAKSVPLTGRVKMELKSNFGEVTRMEITDWSSEK